MNTARQTFILKELETGKSVKEIAALAGCTPRYVQKIKMRARDANREPGFRQTQLKDLVLSLIKMYPDELDLKIAERAGCSDEYVRTLRKKFLPEHYHKRVQRTAEEWLAAGLGTKSIAELMQALNASAVAVRAAYKRLGVARPAREPKERRTPTSRPRKDGILDWSEIDPLLATWNINWLAAKFKRSACAIKKRKEKLELLAKAAEKKEEQEAE